MTFGTTLVDTEEYYYIIHGRCFVKGILIFLSIFAICPHF